MVNRSASESAYLSGERMRLSTIFAIVTLTLLVLACSCSPHVVARTAPPYSLSASRSPSPPASARPVSGGCGYTMAYMGAIPDWIDEAAGHNPPRGLPFVPAVPPIAAAFLFGHPLRAGHPKSSANKILWVVRGDRKGMPLGIDGHPRRSPAPTVHLSQPANAGPGGIYPSIVDVPKAGCWQFTLQWASGRAEIDLEYRAT